MFARIVKIAQSFIDNSVFQTVPELLAKSQDLIILFVKNAVFRISKLLIQTLIGVCVQRDTI